MACHVLTGVFEAHPFPPFEVGNQPGRHLKLGGLLVPERNFVVTETIEGRSVLQLTGTGPHLPELDPRTVF